MKYVAYEEPDARKRTYDGCFRFGETLVCQIGTATNLTNEQRKEDYVLAYGIVMRAFPEAWMCAQSSGESFMALEGVRKHNVPPPIPFVGGTGARVTNHKQEVDKLKNDLYTNRTAHACHLHLGTKLDDESMKILDIQYQEIIRAIAMLELFGDEPGPIPTVSEIRENFKAYDEIYNSSADRASEQ